MVRYIRFLATVLTVCVLCTACGPAEEPAYTFSLDGEPIHPRCYPLDGDPKRLKPGDATLTEQSASALADWFGEKGISLKPF